MNFFSFGHLLTTVISREAHRRNLWLTFWCEVAIFERNPLVEGSALQVLHAHVSS